jgi:phosphotriesterase-related protein
MDELTVDDLAERIVRDVTVGVHDGLRQTDIRAGVIGEIGINGNPLITNERKAMRAAARASLRTGAPVLIHLGGVGREPHEMLDIVADEGVDLGMVIQGHSDFIAGGELILELLSRGVTVAFDILGSEIESSNLSRTFAVAADIPRLLAAGYGAQIVLAHDLCFKFLLKAYGGTGYTFIHDVFLPRLRSLGVTEPQIDALMVGNPARAFTFREPGDG